MAQLLFESVDWLRRRAGIAARTRFAAVLGVVLAGAAMADSPQDIGAQVEDAARRHLERQAEATDWLEPQFDVTVVTDVRRIEACPQPVDMSATDTRRPLRMRFTVSCGDRWRHTVVVRTDVSARVVVAVADVAARQPLEARDLALERRSISATPNALGDIEAVVGLASRRAVHRGDIVRRDLLQTPTLVRRGDAVRIVAQREQVTVSMEGEALESGARGDVVRVRNARTGKVIRARVTDAGAVEPANL